MTVYISELGVRGGGSRWGQNPKLNRSACCAAGRPALVSIWCLLKASLSSFSGKL